MTNRFIFVFYQPPVQQAFCIIKTVFKNNVILLPIVYFLEKEMAIHSSILAWKIPSTEESGGLQSMGSQSRPQLSTSAHCPFLNNTFEDKGIF